MKSARSLITLAALLLANMAGLMAADLSPADRDWQAYEAVVKAPPPKPYKEMTRLEAAQNSEQKTLRLRELGLAFIENHPADPRRWSVVLYFHPSAPRFVKEWGPLNTEGVPDKPVVDEAAAAAWKAKVAELKAALAQAIDVPDEVKKVLAAQAAREANQQGFLAKWRSGKTAAPDFTMHDLSGKEVKLADYRGKVVVLDFWGLSYFEHPETLPHKKAMVHRLSNEPFALIGVNSDGKPAEVKPLFEKEGITWRNAIDETTSGKLATAWRVRGWPTIYVIDHLGVIRAVDLWNEELEAKVVELIKAAKAAASK